MQQKKKRRESGDAQRRNWKLDVESNHLNQTKQVGDRHRLV